MVNEHRANVLRENLPDPDARPTGPIMCGYCQRRRVELAEAPSLGWSVYGDYGHCPDCPPLCHLCGEDTDDALLDGRVPATCSACRGEG